jgi:hypothetical protein
VGGILGRIFSLRKSESIIYLGVNGTVPSIDSWLASVDNRERRSSVLEQYVSFSIIPFLEKLEQRKAYIPGSGMLYREEESGNLE